MNTGQIISGAGHIGLIGWLLVGNIFATAPIPFEVTQVTTISGEEYAALMNAERPPQTASEVTTPEAPEVPQEAPALESPPDTPPDTPPERPEPAEAETPRPDAVPETTQITPPAEAQVTDEAPVLLPPQEEIVALPPTSSVRPKPRPAKRVAPEQVAPPDPDLTIDEVDRPEVQPDAAAETPAPEEEATAREEAATEIVTEAEQAAPSKSVRPKARPDMPRPVTPEPDKPEAPKTETAKAETPKPETPRPEKPAAAPDSSAGIADALAEAMGSATETPTRPSSAPTGPPLTRGEEDALRIGVQKCWNVGSLSSDALATTVIVSVEMTEDSKPVGGSIRMISFSGGSSTAAGQAFEAARRAIIRCGASGFDLPREKYDHWREIEMTFNPENMRIK